MRIPDDVIEAVREATDIVEIIGTHLPLRPAGKRFKANCPFHTEKTPSFHVNPEMQMFHCFGCGTGGNVFTFLMKHQGLTFPEAVEFLASRAGIRLPSHDSPERESRVGALLAALGAATAWFEHNLWDRQAGGKARDYLAGRGLSEETARAARLGYAPAGFDHLRNRLGSKFGLKTLVEAGLLVDRDGGRPYDRFRDRLVFPILGSGGRPIGFGARSLDGSEPKYLNSPETPVYRKREVLYGLQTARRPVLDAGAVWVVEGYMDVLGLRQVGIGHVVAVSGTALTPTQAGTLVRHAPRVTLLFDGDEAGQQAVVRSLPALLEVGLGVTIALLPAGDDPDSLARRGGRAAVEGVVGNGRPVVDFIVSLCQEKVLPAGAPRRGPGWVDQAREQALRQLVELASVISDRVARRLFIEEIARQLGFDEATLVREVEAKRTGSRRGGKPAGSAVEPARPLVQPITRRVDPRWNELLRLALSEQAVLVRVAAALSPDDVPPGPHRRLFERVVQRLAEGRTAGAAEIAEEVDDDEAGLLSELAIGHVPDDRAHAADELIDSLLRDARRREVERLRQEIRQCERAGEDERVAALLGRVQDLVKRIQS